MLDLTRTEVKYLRSLSQKEKRGRRGQVRPEGWRALREAVDAGAQIDYVAVESSRADHDELRVLQQRGVPVKHIRGQDLEKISDTVHRKVVALVRHKRHVIDDVLHPTASLIVATDALTPTWDDLATCDWFAAGWRATRDCSVELHNEKWCGSSAGAIFHCRSSKMWISPRRSPRRAAGFSRAGRRDAANEYSECDFGKKTLVVMGNEGHGVRPRFGPPRRCGAHREIRAGRIA